MATAKKITRSTIWSTLSQMNVNEHVEKAGKLTFLSWPFAWSALMGAFPETTYNILDDKIFADGSMEVGCVINICDNEYIEYLPVMDHRHAAVQNPSATHINKARKRCFTKCIGMAGLGFYIYAGEDLPQKEIGDENASQRVPKAAASSPDTPTNKSASPAGPLLIPCGAMKDKTYSEAIQDANVCQQHIEHWSKNAKTEPELVHLGQLKAHMNSFKKGVA